VPPANHPIVATMIGITTLIVTASGVFVEMQTALNAIWKATPKGTTVSWLIRARAASLGLVAALGFLLMVSLIVSTALMAFVAMATIAREPGGALMFLPEPLRQCSSHVDRRAGRRARNSREQGRLQNHILFWHKNNYRDAEAIGHRT
jgi:Virulence factor BrkB